MERSFVCPNCRCMDCVRTRRVLAKHHDPTPIDWNKVLVRIEEWFDKYAPERR